MHFISKTTGFARIDVLLVRALGVDGNSLPQGLLYLQSFLVKHGYRVRIWDRYVDRNIRHLKKALRNVPVVGISAMSIQSTDATYLCKKIKEWYPRIKIVVGGVHFTAMPEASSEICDHVVIGEGEIAIKDYMDSNCSLDPYITRPPVRDLDDIPPFATEDIAPLIRTRSNFHIITARGCPYSCNFCLGKEQRPGGVRYHSIDYVSEYIDRVVKAFDIRSFNIVDDVFVLSPRRVYEFCDSVEKIGQKIKLECFTHSGHGSLNLYKRMKTVGFETISMGVEHGNDCLLAFCGKKTTTLTIEKTCEQMFKAGININLAYILGNATETNDSISETVDFAIYLYNKFGSSSWFSFAQPLPGSKLFDEAAKYGEYLNCDPQEFSNLNPSYLPYGVDQRHMISERARGMEQANRRIRLSKRVRYMKKAERLYNRLNPYSINNELQRVKSIQCPVHFSREE